MEDEDDGVGNRILDADCGVGYYCPEGTPYRIPCDAGYYCDEINMVELNTAYLCDAGYVCTSGANTQTPTTESTDGGYICPAGHYCPSGTPMEIPCKLQSFRAVTGA